MIETTSKISCDLCGKDINIWKNPSGSIDKSLTEWRNRHTVRIKLPALTVGYRTFELCTECQQLATRFVTAIQNGKVEVFHDKTREGFLIDYSIMTPSGSMEEIDDD